MANGDLAASIGIPTVAATDDKRLGYDEINRALDVIAGHIISGTHPASAVVSGVLALGRIPVLDADRVPVLDASKITSGTLTNVPINNPSNNFLGAAIIGGGYGGSGCSIDAAGNVLADGALTVDGAALVGGNLQVNANATVNGNHTVFGGASIAGAYGNNLDGAAGRRAVWMSTAGTLGFTSSSRRYKQDIAAADLDPDAILSIEPKSFRYRSQVAEHGDDAPVEVGLIAEELIDAGLGAFVFTDEDGTPQGIYYEQLSVALLAVARHQASQIADITSRLERLENGDDRA